MRLTKHFNARKSILIFVSVSILTISTGCSKASNDRSPSPTSIQSQSPASTQVKESLSPSPSAADTQKQDQDLTKKLTSEKNVLSGQVYLTGDDAVAIIMVKKGTDEKTAKDLAAKYAKTMKEKYSNKKINAHAFIEGKQIAHITL